MDRTPGRDGESKCATLVEMLRLRAARQPEANAYTFIKDATQVLGSLTYRDLDRRARSIAAMLQQSVPPGERALLLYPQGLDYVSAFFGCLYAGIIAIPAYPPRPNQTLARILSIAADAQPVVALSDFETKSRIESKNEKGALIEGMTFVATDGPEAATWMSAESSDRWRQPECSANGDAIAYLQYTSGSTASPKGVMVSHRNLMRNLLDMDLGWIHGDSSVLVTWLPFFHDMGLIYGILEPVYKGIHCYFMSPLTFLQRPVRWLRAISAFKGTHSVAPNFAYELCVDRVRTEEKANLDLSSWSVAVNGAEPVRWETLERFAEAFSECGFRHNAFCPGYGLAEATLKVTASRSGEAPLVAHFLKAALEKGLVVPSEPDSPESRALVGCGSSMIDTRVRIVHPEEHVVCPPDQIGEIWLSGSAITRGYWNRQSESDATFDAHLADGEGPFLRTGDLGFISRGELFVAGRLKDMILIRGQNHYPQDIEKTVEQSHPALKKSGFCAAFSVEIQGEEKLVVVQEVERNGEEFDPEDLAGSIRQAVSEEHDLQVYRVVLVKSNTIPRTTSGKVQRRACREGYLAGTLAIVKNQGGTS